jgi:L-threonylcarbamoyladenylate synthase
VSGGSIKQACEDLRQGKVIAYPTEAVWGLGCEPFQQAAVEKNLAIKKRPVEKGQLLEAGHGPDPGIDRQA